MERDAQVIRVEYHKFDGGPHRSYPAIRLGRDGYGTWLGVPGGDFITAAGAGNFKYTDPYVLLVPEHSWWTAMFNAPPRRTEIYCDITTPATWVDGGVHLVDLDLDVRRRRDGNIVELLDEDEFAAHSEFYGYPETVTSEAWAAAKWLLEALGSETQPFAGDYLRWLDQVR